MAALLSFGARNSRLHVYAGLNSRPVVPFISATEALAQQLHNHVWW